MALFISAVLLAAAVQNCGKLTLLNRKVQYLLVLLAAVLPVILKSQAENTSLLEFRKLMGNAATLNELCAMVIIQEFVNIILGFSLLQEDKTKRSGKWFSQFAGKIKYLAFLPSILFFYGAWYLQMYLFNRFTGYSFENLTWLMMLTLPTGALIIMESMRLLYRDHTRRILAVMHLEYILIITAIFLPVAADAKLVHRDANFDFRQSVILLLLFGAVAAVFTIIFYIKKSKKRSDLPSQHF